MIRFGVCVACQVPAESCRAGMPASCSGRCCPHCHHYRLCAVPMCSNDALTATEGGTELCAGCTLRRIKYAEAAVPPWTRRPADKRRKLAEALKSWDYLYLLPGPGAR